MARAHSYIAISRHLLLQMTGNEHLSVPISFREEEHFYNEYILIPVTKKAGFEGVPFLQDLVLWANPDLLNPQFKSQITTIDLPFLRSDSIAALRVNRHAYERCKRVGKIQEVVSVEELMEEFRTLLVDEPIPVDLPQQVRSMLSHVPEGPLKGVLVVSFDQQIAGPQAAEELAREGALVIKVERADGVGDPKRVNSTKTAFNNVNAGKFSIAFDDTPADQQLKAELLTLADIVIDNRREGAQKRDVVLQAALLKKNRKNPLIYCSISGFGPGTDRPGYDRAVQAESGMADLNGGLIKFPLIDTTTGKDAALKIMSNLFMVKAMDSRKKRRMPPIRLHVSMIDVAFNLMGNAIATYIDNGNPNPTIVPWGLYYTKDGRISVAAATNAQFQRLCDALDADDLKKFHSNSERLKNRELVEARLREILATQSSSVWLKILKEYEIAVAPANTLDEALRRYGRHTLRPTAQGSLYVTGSTSSSLFPQNPHIGEAPEYDRDHEAVKALVQHLQQEYEDDILPIIAPSPEKLFLSLEEAAEEPEALFQRNYLFVELDALDWQQDHSNIFWAQGEFFQIKKTGNVHAYPAVAGEVIKIIHNDKVAFPAVAMEGDYVVTTNFGDCYLLSKEKFENNYVPVRGQEDIYKPNPCLKPKKAIQVTQDIKFTTPWGDTAYIPVGGLLVLGSDGPYGIHPNNIKDNYQSSKLSQPKAEHQAITSLKS